ncbi:hypothetical protein Tco_0582128, partial [Tanacetum coccineum]
AKKQGRMAANVSLGFDDHFSAVTPFDMGYENETRNSSCVLGNDENVQGKRR